jgi:uncharacterized membrane protein YgaE (UPF0421/DUF939 family)
MSDTIQSITAQRDTIIKGIMTPYLRNTIREEINKAIGQMNDQVTQINDIIAKQREENPDFDSAEIVQHQRKIAAEQKMLQERLKAMEKTKEGETYPLSNFKADVTLQPGDNIREKLAPVEIVTMDDIVKSIASTYKHAKAIEASH